VVDACQIQASEWMPLTRATHSGTFSDETSLSVVASKARWHPFYGGVTCVNDDATIKLQWVFFISSIFFFSSPYQSMKLSCHLFFISNLVLILLIVICFVFYLFFIDFFPSILSLSFDLIWFDFHIKFGTYSFDF
jgi:hypothetical protein